MKKFFILLTSLCFAFCACEMLEIEEQPVSGDEIPAGYVAVSVPVSFIDTKAGEFTLATDEKVSVWCTDSSNSSNTGFYTFKAKSSGTTVTLNGSIPSTATVGSVALYPASSSHSYASSHYYFSIDRKKNFIGKSYVPADIPMYGTKNSSGKFVFTPMAGAAKFTLSGIPQNVTKVKIVFTSSGAKVSGTYKVYDSSGYSTWNNVYASTDNEKQFIRYFDVVNGSVSIYIPYAQGSIWSGNELKVYDYSTDSTGDVIYTKSGIGTLAVTRGQVNSQPGIFMSAFGIDWDSVTVANSPSSDYPAIRSMKVTADADYLYLLLKADPAAMGSSSHAYDNVLNVYLSNGSEANSSNWIWNKKATNVSAMGGWLRKNGAPYFTSWGGSNVSSSACASDGYYYYEIRYKRSMSSLLSGSSVLVGAYMNNNYQRTDGTYASSYTHVGILPAAGGNMYWLSLSQSGGSSSSQPSELVYKSYTECDGNVKNPERGLYKFVEYKYKDPEHNNTAYPAATYSLTDEYDSDNTLVLALFYLYNYVDGGTLSSSATNYIRNVLTNIRNSGKKAIVRFGYSNQHVEDKTVDPRTIHQEPTKAQILAHIAQIKPILQEFEDIILVGQAGFIGTYGEWYYTTYFSKFSYSGGKWSETRDWTYSSSTDKVTGFDNRHEILDAILDAFPSSRQVEMRTPAYKQFYLNPNHVSSWTQLNGFGTDPVNRLAFHNDAFLYGGSDLGTFHYDYEKAMWQQQAEYLICGGEAPYSSTPISEMEGYVYNNIPAGVYNNHYTYLHHDTAYPSSYSGGSTLFRYWYQKGWIPKIKKMLGYRLYLSSMSINGNGLSSGNSLTVNFTLKNSGAARVINQRPMKLVLLHGSTAYVLADGFGDVRSVPSGTVSGTTVTPGSKSFSATFTLNRDIVSGDKLAIWLPDNASGLRSRAEYSIRLANNETTWTSGGYNVIHTF